MPIPLQPYTFHCLSCGWKKRFAPYSDVLTPEEWPTKCPKCGSPMLKRVVEEPKGPAGLLKRLLSSISK